MAYQAHPYVSPVYYDRVDASARYATQFANASRAPFQRENRPPPLDMWAAPAARPSQLWQTTSPVSPVVSEAAILQKTSFLKPMEPRTPPRQHSDGSSERTSLFANKFYDPKRVREQAESSSSSQSGSSETPMSSFVTGSAADEISLEILSLCSEIGEGSFGKVYRGELCGKEVALKKLKLSKDLTMDQRSRALEKFENEISILKALRHPNIVSFLGVCVGVPSQKNQPSTPSSSDALCLVTEMCTNGSLMEYLKKKKKLSWWRYLQIASDIASGLKFLHHKGVIHRDLKPSNLLMTQSNRVKIADFGLAHMKVSQGFASRPYGTCGTPCFMAPEVIRNETYGLEADIFSFGIVLCQMITGSYPFISCQSHQLSQDFESLIKDGRRPRIPDDCLPGLRELITKCWAHCPADRPSIDGVMRELGEIGHELDVAVQAAVDDMIDDMPPASRQVFTELQRRMVETNLELEGSKSRIIGLKEEATSLNQQLGEKNRAFQALYQKLQVQQARDRDMARQMARVKEENAALRARIGVEKTTDTSTEYLDGLGLALPKEDMRDASRALKLNKKNKKKKKTRKRLGQNEAVVLDTEVL